MIKTSIRIKKYTVQEEDLKKQTEQNYGEKKIEDIFNRNGYESVYFEKMLLKDQIIAINTASYIAMLTGTLSHNLLFARNNSNAIILRKTYKLNYHQYLINQIANINYTIVDCNISPLPILYGKGPFVLKITENFKKFCNENSLICDYCKNSKLNLKEKIWYYLRYIYFYKGKIVDDQDITTKQLRKFYKKTQIKEMKK